MFAAVCLFVCLFWACCCVVGISCSGVFHALTDTDVVFFFAVQSLRVL